MLKLKPYQIVSLNETLKAYEQDKHLLYNMSMGSGKTLTAIAVAQNLMDTGKVSRVLVVCPNNVVTVWPREVVKWYEQGLNRLAPPAVNMKLFKPEKRIENLPDTGFAVVNYESVWTKENKKVVLPEWVKAFKPDMVIADEIHALGSPDTNQSKAMHELRTVAYRLGLSGTPIQNDPLNLWSVFHFLDPKVFPLPYFAFKARHTVTIRERFKSPDKRGKTYPKTVGFRRLDELNAKFAANAINIELSDVVDMPPHRRVVYPVTMLPEDELRYQQIKEDGRRELAAGDQAAALKTALRMRRFLGGFVVDDDGEIDFGNRSKIHAFIALCKELKQRGTRFVVFCQFTAEVETLTEIAQNLGLVAHCLYGQTPMKERQYLIDKYQNGDIDCLICQTQVAGTGITLTRGTVAIFYSLSFKYVEKDQAECRLWRIGQTNMVTTIYLLTENSYDEHVYNTVRQKKNVNEGVTGLKGMFSDGQDGEDGS